MRRNRLGALLCATSLILTVSCSSDPPRSPEDGLLENVDDVTSELRKGQPGAVNGQTDYCDDFANRCTVGEGDCDATSQCTTGLVCGNKNGPRFGFGNLIDVCVPATCTNGLQDSGESGIDCGGTSQCGACLTCPLEANGAPMHCSTLCPCPASEGDCDTNQECQAGLVCKVGVGPFYGQPSGNDVCVPAACNNGIQDIGESGVDCGGTCGGSCTLTCPPAGQSLGSASFCNSTCKCAAGQGDCDANTECQAGLACGFGKGPQFNLGNIDVCMAAHCTNGIQDSGETGVDCGGTDCGKCTTCSGTNGSATFCDNCYCAAGQGNCDSNAECRTGLVCGTANGPQFGFGSNVRVCVQASCNNGVQDNGETGVDCGTAACGGCIGGCGAANTASHCGPTCLCPSGEGDCDTNADCQAGLVCGIGNGSKFGFSGYDYCVPSHCTNGSLDGDETGIDCGGSCGSVGCTPAPTNPSCTGGSNALCGPGNVSCCAAASAPGGTYNRLNNASFPATVASFNLERFEVTVGRFRQFLAAYDTWRSAGGGSHPVNGEGAHPLIANSGWQQHASSSGTDAGAADAGGITWPLAANAATISTALTASCTGPGVSTWTATAGANESKPINCMTWYEAFAFCAWDGGRLATEAEWNFAAAGGSQQRLYPWGNTPAPDSSHASFACQIDGDSSSCSLADIVRPGALPNGNGLYAHADLGGNLWDYTLDAYHANALPTPCTNCADLNSGNTPWRTIRGGAFSSSSPGANLQNTARSFFVPTNRATNVGFRCAR